MPDISDIDYSTPEGQFRRWLIEIEEAEKWSKPWETRAKTVIARYRDETDSPREALMASTGRRGKKRLNIFWSNVETLKPAVLANAPKPAVERRYKDSDPIARAACEVLERAASFIVDGGQFFEVLKQCRDDYLIVGRGTAWVRYVPHFAMVQPPTPEDGVSITDDAAEYESDESGAEDDEDAEDAEDAPGAPEAMAASEPTEQLVHEEVAHDYIAWSDFLMSPARTWREVRWVARKAQMTRAELVERFGKVGKLVKLDATNPGRMDDGSPEDRMRDEIISRANVYEVWCRASHKAYWLAKGYAEGLLDERDDPLRLREFFPCPKPVFSTLTTNSLLPIPDFCLYQDQADELDSLTQRLAKMIEACQNKGVFDKAQDAALSRIMQEGQDNLLIGVNNWAAFSQAGGLKGVMDFVPLDPTIKAIQQLTERAQMVKADIYEITGISDIIRGYSDAAETAMAQRIKGQFAALRLKDRQGEMARFARDLIAMTAEIISEHFQPQTVMQMAGTKELGLPSEQEVMAKAQQEAAQAPDPQQAQQIMAKAMAEPTFEKAFQLLRDDTMRNFRIEIETDSTIAVDEQGDKTAAVEFLTAMGQYLGNALPVAQQAPELLEMLGEGAMFLARRYRAGRQLEASIESGFKAVAARAKQMAQNPQPDPNQAKTEAEVKAIGARTDAEIQALQMKTQAGLQANQAKVEGQMALQQYKALAMQPQQPVGMQ